MRERPDETACRRAVKPRSVGPASRFRLDYYSNSIKSLSLVRQGHQEDQIEEEGDGHVPAEEDSD